MNTYLLYLRFRRLRGELTGGEYEQEMAFARERIAATGAPHWRQFLDAWERGRRLSVRALTNGTAAGSARSSVGCDGMPHQRSSTVA